VVVTGNAHSFGTTVVRLLEAEGLGDKGITWESLNSFNLKAAVDEGRAETDAAGVVTKAYFTAWMVEELDGHHRRSNSLAATSPTDVRAPKRTISKGSKSLQRLGGGSKRDYTTLSLATPMLARCRTRGFASLKKIVFTSTCRAGTGQGRIGVVESVGDSGKRERERERSTNCRDERR
jgi:hypothetical protein